MKNAEFLKLIADGIPAHEILGNLPTLDEAGIKITWVGDIEVSFNRVSRTTTHYRSVGFKWLCCGKPDVMRLSSIRNKINSSTSYCRACGATSKNKPAGRPMTLLERVDMEQAGINELISCWKPVKSVGHKQKRRD